MSFLSRNSFADFATFLVGMSQLASGGALPTGLLEALQGAGNLMKRDKTPPELRRTLQTLADDLETLWTTHEGGDRTEATAARESFNELEPLLLRHMPSPGQVAGMHLNPQAIADEVLRLAAGLKSGLYDPDDRETEPARDFLHHLTRTGYATLIATPGYFATLLPACVADLLARTQRIEENTEELLALVRELREVKATTVGQDTLLAIARKIRPTVRTRDEALRELEAAADIAADLARRGELGSNTDDAADRVLKDLARLTREGRIADAAALGQTEVERAVAGLSAILTAAIDAHLLNRDAEAACALVVKRVLLDDPADPFEALRAEFNVWYERGRDKGINLDLQLAIALARDTRARAKTADQHGTALNDLGNALATLGQRESGTARLEQAITAYRDALTERTRDRVPLDWAMTQNNLGTALRTLGQRESGTARLEQAVTAYRDALTEWTRDRVPLDWAMTQNNLGTALQTLGQRERGTARLEQAVIAYRDALTEWTRDRVPLDWAMTQNNLGTALQTLGQRERGTARLEQAVIAYRDALTEWTRDRVPLDWAMTQNNLGTALQTLGQRESGTARLEQAVIAYRDALTEMTRDRVPLDWATTQNNLGNALKTLGERESGTARLEQAVTAYRDALTERTRDRVPLDWAMTQNNLGNALQTLGERESGTARLEQAVTAYRDALTEWTRDRVPLDWAMTQNNLGTALKTLGERESGTARLEQAVTAYRDALTERTRDRVPLGWAMSTGNQGVARSILAERIGDPKLAQQAIDQIHAAEQVMRHAGHIPFADYYAGQLPMAEDRLAGLAR